MAYQQATSGGHLTKDYTIKEAGYAYLYISNEQTLQTDVYFDDVVMSYTPTNVIQSNEYYPFGLQAANSWTRDNTTNNFLYDAGNELNTTSGFYDLPYRNYDAALGRFFQIDPLAHTSHSLTPYHYAGNNPIGSNDPTGLMVPYYAPGQDPREHLHDRGAPNNNMNDPESWSSDYWENGGPGSGGSYYSGSGIDGAVSSKTPGDYSTYNRADLETEAKYGNTQAANYLASVSPYGPMVAVPDGAGGYEMVSAQEILGCHCNQNQGRIDQALDAISNWRGQTGAVGLSGPGDGWFKNINDSKNYPGINIYQTSAVVAGSAVTIPGIGIFISSSYKPGLSMTRILQHEYGHFLDYSFSADLNAFGSPMSSPWLNYMAFIGVPSAFDLLRGSSYEQHHDFYTEQRADQWAEVWFGNNYKGK